MADKIDKELSSIKRDINNSANGKQSLKSATINGYRAVTKIPVLGYLVRLVGLIAALPHNKDNYEEFKNSTTIRLNNIENRLSSIEYRLDNIDNKLKSK